MPNFWDKLKENWYFIRQDIVSYLLSTALYIFLCLIKECTMQSVIYGLFDCLVFYVPFWYIRINFSNTYHSDSWNHCKMWTRIMLCSGVFVLWLLPIKYSLFNGLFVAFVCCLILYMVAIETDEKKRIKRQNLQLQSQIESIINKEVSPEDKILNICEELGISERDTRVAIMYCVERMKPKQIWEWLNSNNQQMELDSVYKLLNRLLHKINSKLK